MTCKAAVNQHSVSVLEDMHERHYYSVQHYSGGPDDFTRLIVANELAVHSCLQQRGECCQLAQLLGTYHDMDLVPHQGQV